MQYKTTIELISEADTDHEAADICGEYLRGALEDGSLFMRVRTTKLKTHHLRKSITAALLFLAIGCVGFVSGKHHTYQHYFLAKNSSLTKYAVQPPLNTDTNNPANENFKQQWIKEYQKRLHK